MKARKHNRIREAGVDTLAIADTTVLLKLGDLPSAGLFHHPARLLLRGLKPLGLSGINICGAADYLDGLETPASPNVVQWPGAWFTSQTAELSPWTDIIVDASNDPESQSLSAEVAAGRGSHFIALLWGRTWAAVSNCPVLPESSLPDALPSKTADPPIPPVRRVAAGLALQEIIMTAGRLDPCVPVDTLAMYDMAGNDAPSGQKNTGWRDPFIRDVIIDLIGAGGTGGNAAEALVPLLGQNCELRIFDHDRVGPENLPSQIWYEPADIGRPKAEVLAAKLSRFCRPQTRVSGFASRYEDRPCDLAGPSLRIACPDNLATRAFLNELSLKDGVPLAEAGSSPLAAGTHVFLPGYTACLACQIPRLKEKAARERERTSCAENPALTLPGVNMVVSGIVVGESLRAVSPEAFGLPSGGSITYDARSPSRFGIMNVRRPCCHSVSVAQQSRGGS